ncbi:MAG: cob(I)yrinic acid a,c-diamide adenosyltransferase [Planctomycetes bacterium]|nr:cob(I)yrinic acid a,c-diamide adenosyltransferase [Planctomycetota bacterium]
MKIYTKTGDDGSTGLFGGQRVPKHDVRVAAYGTVDELNSLLGLAAAEPGDAEVRSLLPVQQAELFALGSQLAAGDGQTKGLPDLSAGMVETLEGQIDRFTAELPPLTAFILPGGTRLAATLHLARTVCRRAEREVSAIRDTLPRMAVRVMPGLKYMNRLSDWLFVLARLANHRAKVADIPWKPAPGPK